MCTIKSEPQLPSAYKVKCLSRVHAPFAPFEFTNILKTYFAWANVPGKFLLSSACALLSLA
jgi:hypothetical protein